MNCTRCEGSGFLNLHQIPDNELSDDHGVTLKWIAEHDDHDVSVCDCWCFYVKVPAPSNTAAILAEVNRVRPASVVLPYAEEITLVCDTIAAFIEALPDEPAVPTTQEDWEAYAGSIVKSLEGKDWRWNKETAIAILNTMQIEARVCSLNATADILRNAAAEIGIESVERPVSESPEDNCKDCGSRMLFSSRQVGDGYCHRCGHMRLAIEVEGLTELLRWVWKEKEDAVVSNQHDRAKAFRDMGDYMRKCGVESPNKHTSEVEGLRLELQQHVEGMETLRNANGDLKHQLAEANKRNESLLNAHSTAEQQLELDIAEVRDVLAESIKRTVKAHAAGVAEGEGNVVAYAGKQDVGCMLNGRILAKFAPKPVTMTHHEAELAAFAGHHVRHPDMPDGCYVKRQEPFLPHSGLLFRGSDGILRTYNVTLGRAEREDWYVVESEAADDS